MGKLLVFGLLLSLLGVEVASATPVLITITSATTCSDGQPATKCPIASMEVGGALTSTASLVLIKSVPPASGGGPTQLSVDLPPGPACIGVKVVGEDGQKSGESKRACMVVDKPTPAPGVATIQVVVITVTPPATPSP